VNSKVENSLPRWLPFVVGAVLVAQFAGLSVWQINRGLGKLEDRRAFDAAGQFSNFHSGADVRPYQALKASGHLDTERQFLLDNIILNSGYGYYVLTPLETAENEPLLMVNRGWIEKAGPTPELGALAERIDIDIARATVRGRVGSLPKPGVRLGDAIVAGSTWPMLAVYPTQADLEQQLGQPVQPFVLLMDPEDDGGFLRHWVPTEMGPSKHFAYAFQWFAMGAVLTGLLVWHYRKRSL